jgi:hypothetical protein
MALVVTEKREVLRKNWLEKNMSRDVTEPTENLRKTWFENKMAR